MVVVPIVSSHTCNSLHRRLYDERKPLEPSYSTVPISKTVTTYTGEESEDLERLLHAPPGLVHRFQLPILYD